MPLLLISLLLASPALAAERYVRSEAPYTPRLHRCPGDDADTIAEHLYPEMTEGELWFVAREIEFLNPEPGETLTVPVYRKYTGGKKGCYDIRNWFVAVHKGRKYGVAPALLVAIRSHENPSPKRDRYAYGVVIKRHTNLWTQAEWAARIVARIAGSQGWSPMHPTRKRLRRLARVYVGRGEASARNWSKCVWIMYVRGRP